MRINQHPQRFKQLLFVNRMKECAREFQKHRFKLFQMQQDVPKEQLMAEMSRNVNFEMREILREARGCHESEEKVKAAE